MKSSTYAGIALLAACGAAFAQQPLAVPGRSQSAWQQSVDTAACYGYANQTTSVNMARESQAPQRETHRDTRTLTPPRPVEPPLPPGGASGALAASAAVPASGASAAIAASGASATTVAGASAPQGASGAMPASGTQAALAASGASDAIYGGDMKMPPLPPPEPPMVRYWRAYSDCMQNRGYFVR